MNIFDEEKKYLDNALECINNEITFCEEEIERLRKEGITLTFEDKKRGAHLNLGAKLGFYADKIKILTNAIPSPYFGRFDFRMLGDRESKPIYIGKTNVNKGSTFVITDWRAPICSLYYDSNVGFAEYESPGGIIKGNLELKRQINVENSKLIDVVDSNLVTNDELLKPYLSSNADNKMKTIIETIQKEQNQIIRKPITDNIIVQGVAGSGKTSVALHRIAYLIYNLGSEINSNQFLVLGPNDYFLNYISSILPELETEPVAQKTFLSLANEYLNENLSFNDINNNIKKCDRIALQNIESYKSSLEFKRLLELFLENYISDGLVSKGFEIDGETIYTVEDIKKMLFYNSNKYPNFDSACNYFVAKFREKMDEIYERLNQKYRNIYISLPKGDPERKEAIDKSTELHKLVKENGVKLLKDYFKKLKAKPLDLYKIFIASLNNYDNVLSEKELLLLQKNTLISLRKKKVSFEDLPAIMYINYALSGDKIKYKHIVIDEAQDYGLFHFDILKTISDNKSTFSIYGDLAQAIYSYRSIGNWEALNKEIFNNTFEILNLSKSYRTTIEITNNANNILHEMNLNLANPVIRHGNQVEFLDDFDDSNYKLNKIKTWIEKGYKTIAVICKTENEAKETCETLANQGIDIKYISEKDEEYNGGVFVLTSASAKGLEFDAVIVNDASSDIYLANSEVDMHLLYVACTRALHEQVILYKNELTKPFKHCVVKKEEKVKVKK